MSVLHSSALGSRTTPTPPAVLCCHTPVTRTSRLSTAPASGHSLRHGQQRKRNLSCSSRRSRYDKDDFADKVARQVEDEVRRAMDKSAMGSKWSKKSGSADFASDVADKVERSIRKIREQPGRAMLVGGAVLLGLGMIIGPAIAAISLAVAGLSISVASSMAFGAIMVAFSMAFGAMALGIFGGFALPLLAPGLIMLGVGFLVLRTFLNSSAGAEPTAERPTVDPKMAAEEEERRKREREEEERKREIEQELRDFDDLLSKKKRF